MHKVITPKFKGVVLAAGLGSRLSPLTKTWPKPLVPFLGTTPLELALWRLKLAGLQDVAINAHHLPDQIRQAAARNPFSQSLYVAYEATLLGTGGVYGPLSAWRENCNLVILNGDVISTIDVARLMEHHVATGASATMALLPQVLPGESAVWYEGHHVRAIGRESTPRLHAGNFACAQVLSHDFLELLPKSGAFDIISRGYRVALERGLTVSCLVHHGLWHDLRTPQFYWEALKDCLKTLAHEAHDELGLKMARSRRGLLTAVGEECVLRDGCAPQNTESPQLGPWAVVEVGAVLGPHCQVRESVLLPGASVRAEESISGRILGPAIDIALV